MTRSDDLGRSRETTSARGERTRSAILEAAAALIGESGWEGVSTRDIAARAGVAQGVVTYHWRTKDELLRDAALAVTNELFEPLAAALEAAPLADVLVGTVRTLGGLRDEPGTALLLMETMLRTTRDETMRTAFAALLADYRARLVAAVQRDQAAGRLRRDVDAVAVAAGLAALLDGLILHAFVDESLDLEGALRSLLAGVGAPAGSG